MKQTISSIKHIGIIALVVLGLSGCGHKAATMTYHTTGWYTKHLSVAKKLNTKCRQMQSMGTGVVAHDCFNANMAITVWQQSQNVDY